MKKEPLIIERILDAPVSLVWDALTDNSKMKKWYFDIDNFIAKPGFEFQFYGSSDDKRYLHLCKILEVDRGKKLSYSWKYQDYAGASVLTFELFEGGGKTRLKLTHEGLETFPSDLPDFTVESFTAGWNYIIGTSLKQFVETASTQPEG